MTAAEDLINSIKEERSDDDNFDEECRGGKTKFELRFLEGVSLIRVIIKDVKRPGGMVLVGIWVSALAISIQLHYFLFTISPHFINIKKRKIISTLVRLPLKLFTLSKSGGYPLKYPDTLFLATDQFTCLLIIDIKNTKTY